MRNSIKINLIIIFFTLANYNLCSNRQILFLHLTLNFIAMKNLLICTLFLPLFLSSTNGQAQNKPSATLASKNVASADVIVTSKSTLQPARTVEEARNRFMALFNLYRDYSITIDDIALNDKVMNKNPQQEVVVATFGSYLEKIAGILTKKLDKLTTNTVEARAERSHYLSGLNTLKSAKCLQSDDQKRVLVTTKDANGNSLMAFDLDGIRGNSRYGLVENYHEGFARIRKDQVYGYLNLCGDEVITCQYERAEPFNAGRALVKRVDWYFVDGEGNETEALENIAEVKALKQGIYLVRTLNGKQAFIDNNYDVTKVSLSQLYDGIDSFYRKDVFKVRNNKKLGLISLNGKTIFDAIYDNVESTNLSGIYRIYQNKGVGLLDTTWAIRTSPTYDFISDFNS